MNRKTAQDRSGSLCPHMDVNYMGVVNAVPALIEGMLAHGAVRLLSCQWPDGAAAKAAAYGPTKAALISLAESLTFDLAPRGIDVKVICPGFVDTESTAVNDYEMPGLISAETAAREIISGLATRNFLIQFPKSFYAQDGMAALASRPDLLSACRRAHRPSATLTQGRQTNHDRP